MRFRIQLFGAAVCLTFVVLFATPSRALDAARLLHPSFGVPALSDFASKRNLSYLALGSAATWLVVRSENSSQVAATLDGWRVLETGSDFGNVYGDGAFLAASTLGLFATGRLLGDSRLTNTAADLSRSLAVTSIVTWTLKAGIDRARPSGGRYSFPSGHTATAFAIAPVLRQHFGWKVGLPAYTLATLTGLGRLEDKRHYPTDVIAGAALGLIVGNAVTQGHTALHLPGRVNVDRHGIGLHFQF